MSYFSHTDFAPDRLDNATKPARVILANHVPQVEADTLADVLSKLAPPPVEYVPEHVTAGRRTMRKLAHGE